MFFFFFFLSGGGVWGEGRGGGGGGGSEDFDVLTLQREKQVVKGQKNIFTIYLLYLNVILFYCWQWADRDSAIFTHALRQDRLCSDDSIQQLSSQWKLL